MFRKPNNRPPRELPTTSLYFRDSLRGSGLWTDWDSCRTGPFSFRFGDRLVIVRYATDAEVELAGAVRKGGGRVIYVVDDDLEAIAADSNLPVDYRGRISEFLSGPWQELKNLAGEAVVSSAALVEKMRGHGIDPVTLLDPFWPIPDREPAASDSDSPVQIAWLCSRSHSADLESIAGDLERVLSGPRKVRLTVLFGGKLPRWLKRSSRIENLEPLAWPEYRQWIEGRTFDLALYPLSDTEVNRGRSINKFLEHAFAGAASVISANAPFASRLESGDCVFAGAGEWGACLESLLADRARIGEIAIQARNKAREISEAARIRQIDFWRERLPALESRKLPDAVQI